MLAADFLTNEPSDVCKRIYTKNFLKIMIWMKLKRPTLREISK
jgi:hypothetical protein